jgi:hypothetical protein
MRIEFEIVQDSVKMNNTTGGDCFFHDDNLLMATDETNELDGEDKVLCVDLEDGEISYLSLDKQVVLQSVKVVANR